MPTIMGNHEFEQTTEPGTAKRDNPDEDTGDGHHDKGHSHDCFECHIAVSHLLRLVRSHPGATTSPVTRRDR